IDVYIVEYDKQQNTDTIKDIQQTAAAKFSLYQKDGCNYIDTIYEQIETMKQKVTVQTSHYSTKLHGETLAVFPGLEQVFRATKESGSSYTVMTVSISANSPSHT